MPLIKMTVKGQSLKQYNSLVIAEDSSDLLKMQFNFRSSDWAAVAPKTINFIGVDGTMPIQIFENKTLKNKWVHNKSLQKARESLRISKDVKEYLKELKA